MQNSVRGDCRLCGGKVHKVFELRPSPIANSYPKKPDSGAEKYPLELMACEDCGHVQQHYVLNGLFVDYKYQTPHTVATYLEPVAKKIADRNVGARVLEIGCNNGVFLDCLVAEGLDAWGIDPSTDHYRGLKACFTDELAKTLGKFNVIVGNNVFAHIDDLHDVFRGITKCLELDGTLVFEVQYLVDLVKSGSFDMIYHEHLDYHTLKPLARFLKAHGLVMTEWDHIPAHGGSIRVWAKFFGDECELPDESLDWDGLKDRIGASRDRLKAILNTEGSVVCFGAAAKASTLINEFGISDSILYCVDDTPQKQFRYIPGTDIQILPTSALKPDQVVLLTAWNYEKEIAAKIPNKLINPFR